MEAYVFNKRVKQLIRMLRSDVPSLGSSLDVLYCAYKTVKAISRSHLRNVYMREVMPRYSEHIRTRTPFFLDAHLLQSSNIAASPTLQWLLPYTVALYDAIPEERRPAYWREIQALC